MVTGCNQSEGEVSGWVGGVFLFQGRLNHAASARLHTGNLFLCNTRFNHLTAVLLKAVHQKKEGWGGDIWRTLKGC